MTEAAVVFSNTSDSGTAGAELGEEIRERLRGDADAVILFASARHDYEALLGGVARASRSRCLTGASSAGEYAGQRRGEGASCALALRSDSMRFAVGVGERLRADRRTAAQDLVRSFQGRGDSAFPHRTALVMADALAGHTDELLDELRRVTGGGYQLVGGGAGDDGRFQKTHVFCGTRAYTDAVVALEILSLKPVGVGMTHGWTAASPMFRVTDADGMTVRTLNGIPAMELFEEHAEETGQKLDSSAPFPFFLQNILGIESADGFQLRVPLSVDRDGAVACAADVPAGAVVRIMRATSASVVEAGATATRSALAALDGARPVAALFFDCVATRLGIKGMFDVELDGVRDVLASARLAGCNTYGQIGDVGGRAAGFQNCNAVACVFPE